MCHKGCRIVYGYSNYCWETYLAVTPSTADTASITGSDDGYETTSGMFISLKPPLGCLY